MSDMGQLASHHGHETVIPFDLIFILAILYFFFFTCILYFLLILWVYVYFTSFTFYITFSFQSVVTGRAVLQVGKVVENEYRFSFLHQNKVDLV